MYAIIKVLHLNSEIQPLAYYQHFKHKNSDTAFKLVNVFSDLVHFVTV